MNPSEKPLGTATTLSGALITLAASTVYMLTALGVVHWDTGAQAAVNSFVIALVSVGSLVGPYLWARTKTTPLAKPTDEEGKELVRKVDGMPTQGAVRAMARGRK